MTTDTERPSESATRHPVSPDLDEPVNRLGVRLARPVPTPGRLLTALHAEWDDIEEEGHTGSPELPRPWEPATCTAPLLRKELWEWLDRFVQWVNHECVWDPADLLPPCWPSHPHLVHELAVLAEQRRQAGRTATATALEHWQVQSLPAFLARCQARLRRHCAVDHQPTPSASAHARYHQTKEQLDRQTALRRDLAAAGTPQREPSESATLPLSDCQDAAQLEVSIRDHRL